MEGLAGKDEGKGIGEQRSGKILTSDTPPHTLSSAARVSLAVYFTPPNHRFQHLLALALTSRF